MTARPFWFCTHCRQMVRVDDRGNTRLHIDARAAELALSEGPVTLGGSHVCGGSWSRAIVVAVDGLPSDWEQPS